MCKIYSKYSSGASSKEYENAPQAQSEIEKTIKAIRTLALRLSFAGKQAAMIAIVDIAFKMLDEGSTLSHEIRKNFRWMDIGDAIEKILDQLQLTADQYGLHLMVGGAIDRITEEPDEWGDYIRELCERSTDDEDGEEGGWFKPGDDDWDYDEPRWGPVF